MEITLPHNWRPRDYQIPMWRYMEHGGRRSVLLWHRRAGKDDNSLRYLASAAMEKTATYWYLLPKAVQVRRAIWEAVNPHTGKRRVIEAFPDAIVARTRGNEMTLTLANGSSVHFLGADNFDTLVGSPPYGIVFSEYSLTNPLSWAYLKPILEENGGWAIFNFTSRGRNHAATLYEYAAGEESWFAQRLPVTETSVLCLAHTGGRPGARAGHRGAGVAYRYDAVQYPARHPGLFQKGHRRVRQHAAGQACQRKAHEPAAVFAPVPAGQRAGNPRPDARPSRALARGRQRRDRFLPVADCLGLA